MVKKNRKGSSGIRAVDGYLPCFSRHKDDTCSIRDFYGNKVFVDKVARFLQAITTTTNTADLINSNVCKKVDKITPDSQESKRIIQLCRFEEGHLWRAKWGNCPYRLVFGLDQPNKRCYIFMLDNNHETYSGKNKR